MESAWGARWWVGNIRRTSREARRAVPGRLARYCGCARSYICSGRGPAGFPEGPTGTAAPPRLVSSAGTGWRAFPSRPPRSSVSRCWLWPLSSCTLTSCCCTASRSVFTSPRSCTRYACCAVSFSCAVRSHARTVSISLARLLARRRAPVAERQLVFVGPALVAMAADPNPQARVSLEDRPLLIQDRGVPAPDDRLVIVEVDHGREQGPHCLRRLSERGERIRRALPRLPFRRFTVTGLLLGPLACFLRCPLGGVDRILIDGHRRGRCLRRLTAARGHGRHGATAQPEP